MFRKISLLVLASFIYINSMFAAALGSEKDWCASLHGLRVTLSPGRPHNKDDMLKAVHTYSREPEITKTYMDGHPRDPRKIRDIFNGAWSEAWSAKSPFGMRFVSASKDLELEGCADTPEGRSKFVLEGEHLGMVGFTHYSEHPKTVQIFYLFEPFIWANGIGTEVVDIIIGQHLKALVDAGVPLPDGPIEHLAATALKEGNVASNRILQRMFGDPVDTVVAYGAARNLYLTPVDVVLANFEARMAEKASGSAGAATA